ncbi:outer membrane biogenesis protein BamB [Neorhodopirellula pilleata]|uniref:Outer membrane biogenesis protein BamB n=1 Tax=Neorhodopirellula pilleata TaxID=2714738 RepID=A0A5C5ZGT9_9BACT|nr:outer membrane biogenesis protein BamB [Neorhodopirellula pilleata]
MPLVEPTVVDQPDTDAVTAARANQSTLSDTEEDQGWPALFGPDRTSSVDAAWNPIWSSNGPKVLWETEVGTGYGSPVALGGLVVFSHRLADEEIVQCHDALTGTKIWDYRHSTSVKCEFEYSDGPYSTPLIEPDRRRVFVVSGEGRLSCVELDTGEHVWTRDFPTEYELEPGEFPVGATPFLDGNRLIHNLGAGEKGAGIVALDAENGATLWEATDHGAAYCSPLVAKIHDQRFLFVFTDRGLVCLDPDTGIKDWEYPHFSRAPLSYNAVSPLVFQDKVLIVTGPGPGAVCVQIKQDRTFEEVWKNRRVINCQYNTLMLRDGLVYSFTSAGQGGAELRCVEFATGKLRWRYHSVLRRGQGLIAGDALLLLGERGHLASLACTPDEPRVLSFTQEPLMSDPCYCSPALSNGILFLKDEERVVALDVRPLAEP